MSQVLDTKSQGAEARNPQVPKLNTDELIQQVWQAPNLEAFRIAAGYLIADQHGKERAQANYVAALTLRVVNLIMEGETDTIRLLDGIGVSRESAQRYIHPENGYDRYLEVNLAETAGVARDDDYTGVIRYLADQIIERQLPGLRRGLINGR